MGIAVLIALVAAAIYLVKFLICGVQFMVKITRQVVSRITGNPVETEEPEKEIEKQDELMDALFPGGAQIRKRVGAPVVLQMGSTISLLYTR